MRIHSFAIFLVLAALVCVVAPREAGAASAGRDYGESVKALQQKKWKKAESSIREALSKEDTAQESILISGGIRFRYIPYFVLGSALQGQGDCQGALEAWQESLRQGQVQNSAKEFGELQAGMRKCGASMADITQPAAKAPGAAQSQAPAPARPVVSAEFTREVNAAVASLEELRQANNSYSDLAENIDLAPEWPGKWKPALDTSQRERLRLEAELDAVRKMIDGTADVGAVKAIIAQVKGATDDINAVKRNAQSRVTSIRQQRLAQTSAREEERKRQEALDKQRRETALRERQETDKRRQELEQRQRVAAAQNTLREELAKASPSLDESSGDGRVIGARGQLAYIIVAGEAMLASTSVKDLNDQAQLIRDGLRRYNQARQEWEGEQREIALRTPPPELKTIADAYFEGDYEKVSRIVDPGNFSDKRHKVQAYLFRSAARFNTYWLTGANDQALLEGARKDISEIKRLNRSFVPYLAAFSPKYMIFFQDS